MLYHIPILVTMYSRLLHHLPRQIVWSSLNYPYYITPRKTHRTPHVPHKEFVRSASLTLSLIPPLSSETMSLLNDPEYVLTTTIKVKRLINS